MASVSGYVYASDNSLAAGRTVRAYRRDTGAYIGAAVTGDGSVTGDPDFDNVTLLLHFEGSAGSTTFTDSGPYAKGVAAVGGAQLSTSGPKFGSACGSFDGATDALTVNYPERLRTDDFTLEMFVLRTGTGTRHTLYDSRSSGSSAAGFAVYIHSDDVLSFETGNPAVRTYGTLQLSAGVWYHVAVERTAGTVTLYVDGEADAAVGNSADFADTPLKLASDWAGGNTLNGRLDEVRITKGVARYGDEFDPPTTTFGEAQTETDPLYLSTTLLLRFNGSEGSGAISDDSPWNATITNTSVTCSGTITHFSTFSGYFSAGFLQTSLPAFRTGDFTIETWIYRAASGVTNFIFDNRHDGGTGGAVDAGFVLTIDAADNKLYFGRGAVWNSTPGVTAVSAGAWHHVMLCRASAAVYCYLDGALEFSTVDSLDHTNTAAVVGGRFSLSNGLTGYLDDFRVTHGVARSTGPSCEVPTEQMPILPPYAIQPLGGYLIDVGAYAGEINVICLDDSAGTTENDLILRTIGV